MGTRKTTVGTRTKLTASVADLGSVIRLNPNNFNAFSFSFVLDKTLKLIEAPVAYPIVHSFSSPLFPDTFEVFHYNLVSVEDGNNVFTDVMINPSHEPLLFSTQLFEKPSGTLSAFGLKFTTQVSEPSFDLFDLCRIIKSAVRCDSKVVYSAVNTKNSILDIRAFGINCFGECEHEEASAFFIHSEKALSDIPTEIFFVAVRDGEWNFNPTFDCSQRQDIVLEGSGTREVVSHGTSKDYWFRLSFLDHSTGLFDTSDSELALQSVTLECRIDKRMQFDVIPYLVCPSSVDAKLQSFSIDSESFNYLRSCRNLDFSCYPDVHNGCKEQPIFKNIGGKFAFLPTLKGLGIQANTII